HSADPESAADRAPQKEGFENGTLPGHRGFVVWPVDLQRLLLVGGAMVSASADLRPRLLSAGLQLSHKLFGALGPDATAELDVATAADELQLHVCAVNTQLMTLRPLWRSYQRRNSASQRFNDVRAIRRVSAAISNGPMSRLNAGAVVAA